MAGHRSFQVTMDVYGHLFAGRGKKPGRQDGSYVVGMSS